jgi:histidinol-phosphate/aromatic aminotransferase/cobyric acid decarboxylase-like protein
MPSAHETGKAALEQADDDRTQRQGGDLRDLPGHPDYLDLSTCANRYGPPDTVRSALREIDPVARRAHSYDAEARFLSAYAEYLGIQEPLLAVGRGITEFIQILGRILPAERVAVLTPDYTETMAAFPRHLGPAKDHLDTPASRLLRIERAMRQFDYVVASNPNNPLGIYVPRDDLASLCATARQCQLAQLPYRCPRRGQRAEVGDLGGAGPRETGVTAREMESMLVSAFGAGIRTVPVHYRFVPTTEPGRIWRELLSSGVVVRAFRAGDPSRIPGIRVAAPVAAELPKLRSALSRLAA